MADIRINALATTATTPASDDYLALDGTAQGTRKILATNIANNVTDVILGASGPSVKSTLSARAPRQGLVFDGTAGATGTAVTIGTADLTFSQWVRVPSTVSETRGLFLFSPAGSIGATSLLGYVDSDATLNIHITGATSGDRTKQTLSGFVTSYAGKWVNILFTRVGSTWTGYINGVATTFSASTSGTAPTWAGSISGAVVNFGSLGSSGAIYNDAISAINLYNRALSASEVVALYEAGAPAGADYNSASNTAVYSTDFSSSTGWSLGGSTTISGGKLNLVSDDFAGAPSSTELVIGKRYRFTITVDSITAGNVSYFNGAAYVSFATSAGTYTVDFTAAGSYSFIVIKSIGGNAVCDTFAFYKTGLLLAPDAAQAGGGLVWYDTSGNAANISWTSGVSWNVPSSSYWGGSLNVNGTGTSSVAGKLTLVGLEQTSTAVSGIQWKLYNSSLSGTNSVSIGVGKAESSGATVFLGWANNNGTPYGYIETYGGGSPFVLQAGGGNLLIGKTIDSSNGKLQLATHTTSAGGIGFGTDISVYRKSAAVLGCNGVADLFLETAGAGLWLGSAAGTYQVGINRSSNNLVFWTGSFTTALTLDSSQNATFAKTIKTGSGSGETLSAGSIDVGADIGIASTQGIVQGGARIVTFTSGNATFAGAIAIGNTVNTVSPTSPNRTITMVIGGTTYYIHAKTTND